MGLGGKGGFAPKAGLKQFTMEEVARHNKPEDAWLVIHGKVGGGMAGHEGGGDV